MMIIAKAAGGNVNLQFDWRHCIFKILDNLSIILFDSILQTHKKGYI